MAAVSLPSVAAAVGNPELSVNGVPLAGSVQPDGDVTVTAGAPAGVTVKFKMDGTYLGRDSSAPYTLPIRTGSGTHKVEARWDLDGRQTVAADFRVASGTEIPSAPIPAPAPITAGAVTVFTAAELSAALLAAAPGQTIQLRDGLYIGKFVASPPGLLLRQSL